MIISKKLSYSLYSLAFIATMILGALSKDYIQSFYEKLFKKEMPQIVVPETGMDSGQYLQKSRELFEAHEYEQSLAYAKKALELNPTDLNIMQQLGQSHLFSCETETALSLFTQIRDALPNNAQAEYNIGYVYARRGETQKVIDAMNKALAINPDHQLSHVLRGEAIIKLGNFEKGWPDFAWHWNQRFMPGCWDAIDFKGKRVVFYDVQGLGDSIQFIRYIKELKKRGARTILNTVCKPLIPLYSRCTYIDEIIIKGDPIPQYDYYAPLMALPMIFNSNNDTMPKEMPFLNADPKLVQFWKEKLAGDSINATVDGKKNLKVALSWHADQKCELTKSKTERKSIPLTVLYSLLRVPGVSFYSLQKLDGVEELAHLPSDIKVHDFGPDFDTKNGRFMDTAAVIQNMDLVISVDTSIAHVAAGLAKPTWMILNFPGDWRWLEDRSDSPWYPTMKIFRKPSANDWEAVAQELENELRKLVSK